MKAVRQGYWVLLDEINLATTETLEVDIFNFIYILSIYSFLISHFIFYMY